MKLTLLGALGNGKQRSTKDNKERTDSNSPAEPNEAVRVATLLLKYLLDRDKRTPKWKAPLHPSLPPAQVGRKRK